MTQNDEAERPAYLICKYGGYYRPNCQGYTDSAIQAGRYTMAEAEKFTHPNGPYGPRDGMHYVHEDEVICDDLKAYRTQAARIAELEASLQAVLRREEDANKAAFAHMRRITALEADGIAARKATAKNYARAEAAEAALAEMTRRRDEWRKKAEGYDAVRLALREKVGTPWPANMSRLLWAGIAADEKKRADDAEAALAEAEARTAALVAGAYEAAAKACNDRGIDEQFNYGLSRSAQNYYRARDAIRSLTPADATAALARMTAEAKAEGMREAIEADCRQWFYYPIEMPVTDDGEGPATVGVDAAQITYEVWDRLLNTHASFDNLPDAINEAIRLNAAAAKEAGE